MSIRVGITTLKLTNKEYKTDKERKKHGNLTKVCQEAMSERQSTDPDLDRSKSHLNEYINFDMNTSGDYTDGKSLADDINKTVRYMSKKQVEEGGKKIRDDAVIGFALIVKPSADSDFGKMSPEDQERFLDDSFDVLFELQPMLVRGTFCRARHKEEGNTHDHYIGMPITEDGRLCGKEFFSLKSYAIFNREYPRKMRELGWDVEDLVGYDPDPDYTDEQLADYKSKHIDSKREKQHAVSSRKYKARKEREKVKALQEELEKNRLENERILSEREQLTDQNRQITENAQVEANDIIAEARAEADRIIAEANEKATHHIKQRVASFDKFTLNAVKEKKERMDRFTADLTGPLQEEEEKSHDPYGKI